MSIVKPEPYNWRKHTRPENKSRLSNSRTVPAVTYSIRELLDKFTSGQPINNMMSYNEYDGDYENSKNEKPDFDGFLPHPKTLDLVERQLLQQKIKEELKNIDNRKKQQDEDENNRTTSEQKKILELTKKIEQLEKPTSIPTV